MTSPDQSGIPEDAVGHTVGEWGFEQLIDGLGDGMINFVRLLIAAALRMLADLLGDIPIVGDALEDVLDGIAGFIGDINDTATSAANTAASAQSTANNANTNATNAINAANTASTAASNAANAAAAAQATADIAYANAQQWKDEFMVSSAGVSLGKNEVDLGVVMDLPDDGIARVRKITALRYGMKTNTGTMTIELRRTTLAGVESTIWTTNIPNAVTKFRDNGPDITVNDGDYISCHVAAMSGVASVLQCAVIGVLLEAE